MIYFTTYYPSILESIRLSCMDQAAHLALVTLTPTEDDKTNVYAPEVVAVAMVEVVAEDVEEA